MKTYKTIYFFLFFYLAMTLNAQQPQLWLQGKMSIDTLLAHGFEDKTLGPFTTDIDHPWTIDSSNASEGIYFAKATDPPIANQTSNLDLSITIPANPNRQATLLFDIKNDGTGNYFRINNEIIHNLPVSPFSWLTLSFDLAPGQYDLKWSQTGFEVVPKFFHIDNIRIISKSVGIVRIEDGTEGEGKVLTSDAFGGASWQKLNGTSQIDTNDMSGLQIIYDPETDSTGCNISQFADDGVGILVTNAPSKSFSSLCTEIGFFSSLASENGFYAYRPENGFYAYKPDDDGFYAEDAFDNGFVADNSGRYGFMSRDAFESGFYAENSGEFGYLAGGSAVAGYITIESDGYGYVASSPEDDGFYALESGINGFFSEDATNSGFKAKDSGTAGFATSGAGTFGLFCMGSFSDGIQVSNSGEDGIFSFGNTGHAGHFSGTVEVTGNLSKGGGSFKIDHPLDPENKFLYHSFVESPDMMNVYNGNIILDENGEAIVTLPEYFEVLNRDFRYQLTCVGGFAQIYIKEEIRNNRFKISGGFEGLKVSWQVTGIRQDPYANKNRIEVEVEKPDEYRGQYIHPEVYDKPFEKGFDYIKLGRKTLEELRSESGELGIKD